MKIKQKRIAVYEPNNYKNIKVKSIYCGRTDAYEPRNPLGNYFYDVVKHREAFARGEDGQINEAKRILKEVAKGDYDEVHLLCFCKKASQCHTLVYKHYMEKLLND